MSLATILATISKKVYWLFEVDLNNDGTVDYYWSTGAKTYGGHDYTYRIISFSPISLQMATPEVGMLPEVKTTILASMKDASIDGYYASDFEGAKVTVRLVVSDGSEEAEAGAWSFRCSVATSVDQKLMLQCHDWLSYYLEGDYPNTALVSSLFPATVMKNDNICVPVVYGVAYFPLRWIYPYWTATFVDVDTFTVTGDQTATFSAGQYVICECGVDGNITGKVLSSSYSSVTTINMTGASGNLTANLTKVRIDHYLLGPTGVTYTISSSRSPVEAGFLSEYSSANYTFKQATVTGSDGTSYRAVQLLCNDADVDGTNDANGFWGIPGKEIYDVPFYFSRSDTASITNPADVYSAILQDMGVPAGMINTTEITAAAAIYLARGTFLNLGIWYQMSRKKLVCKLLAMIGAVPTIGETIGLKVLTPVSQATVNEDEVAPGSFQIQKIYTKLLKDSGYVTWQNQGEPLDQPNKGIVPVKSSTNNKSDTVIEAEWIDDAWINASQAAQKYAKLALQRSLLRDKTISFKSFAILVTLEPGDIISIEAANEGAEGNYDLLTDGNLDIWTSATNLTHWAETIGGTSTVNRDTDKYIGTYAARLYVDPSSTLVAIQQSYAFEADQEYEVIVVAKVDVAAAGRGFTVLTDAVTIQNQLCTASYTVYAYTFTATTDTFIQIKRSVSGGNTYSLYLGQVIVRKTGTNAYDALITKMTIHEGLWVDVECDGFSDILDAYDDLSASAIVPADPDTSRAYSPVNQGPSDAVDQAGTRANEITQTVLITDGQLQTNDDPATNGGFVATNQYLRCYNDEGGLRFEVIYDGTTADGDVTIGNYAGGQGAKWDQSSGIFEVQGQIQATSGAVAGWTIDADEIKKIASNAGISLNSATPGISITDANGYIRVFMGKNGSDYGIYIKNELNQTIVQLDDNVKTISGWTAGMTALAVSTNIILDASNKKISINSATFGTAGIQLEYNAGSPQIYAGNGSSDYMKYTTAGGIEVSTSQAGGIQIRGGGDITLTGSDTDPGRINFAGTSYSVQMGGDADGNRFSFNPSADNQVVFEIGDSSWWGTPYKFRGVNITAKETHIVKTGDYAYLTTDVASVTVDAYGNFDNTAAVVIGAYDITTETDSQYVFEYDHFGPRLHNATKDLGSDVYPWRSLFLGEGSLCHQGYKNDSFADDATYALPEGMTGVVTVFAVTTVGNPYGGTFLVRDTGAVVLLAGYGSPTTTDTDGYLCCYDGGAGAIVANRLNYAVKIRISWCS
jgi:hypothetical protein